MKKTKIKKITSSVPKRMTVLFPEYDIKTLRINRYSSLILSRILEHGNSSDIRWALSHFSLNVRKNFLQRQGSRTLSPRTLYFWSWLWKIPKIQPLPAWREQGRQLGGIQ